MHRACGVRESYPRTRGGGRSRHLCRLTSHGKLSLSIAGGLHVGELEGAFFAQVVVTARQHDLRLAGKDGVAGDLDRLQRGCTVNEVRSS